MTWLGFPRAGVMDRVGVFPGGRMIRSRLVPLLEGCRSFFVVLVRGVSVYSAAYCAGA